MARRDDIRDDVLALVRERTEWGETITLTGEEIETETGYSASQVGHTLGRLADPHDGIGWDILTSTAYRFYRLPPVGGEAGAEAGHALVLKEMECPCCEETFYGEAVAAEVEVRVEHESLERGSIEKVLEPGQEAVFRNDEPTYTRITVEERETP